MAGRRMSRAQLTILGQADRDRAADWVAKAPVGTRIEFKALKRSPPQNSRLWAMLSDVADQLDWHGVKLNTEEWKWLFLDALKREVRVIPNLDGNGFVNIGRSSSDLSKEEFSNLLELIAEFGARHSVTFHDDEPESNSSGDASLAHAETDAPAANGPHAVAAGVREEASLLSDDWRDVYITTMTTPTTRAQSILSRHQTAIQMLGGEPNEQELAWMRLVAKLVSRRDENRLRQGEVFTNEIEQLRTMPLPAAKVAA